jgi:hypothetical protein
VSTALVISDFPIISLTVRAVLDGHYEVLLRTWTTYVERPASSVDLVVVDTTTVSRDIALAVIARQLPGAHLAVCSLHHNEVDLYRVDPHGLTITGAVSTLLELGRDSKAAV